MIQKDDVARLRSHLGLSREKFAQKLGVDVSTVGRWERGLRMPRGQSLHDLEWLTKQLRRRVVKR